MLAEYFGERPHNTNTKTESRVAKPAAPENVTE